MTHSLNEIEATAKRAARGAGLSWGIAEEAAKACRWLASHKLPGVTALAELLTLIDGVPHRNVSPISLDGAWTAPSGRLCPLASGTALNDCAELLLKEKPIEMINLSYPLLLIPFAAWASVHINTPVKVSWSNVTISTNGKCIEINNSSPHINVEIATVLSCYPAKDFQTGASKPGMRGIIEPSAWVRLTEFSDRTYAPATDASRRLGEGSGNSDND